MEGLHIIANFYGCKFDLTNNKELLSKCIDFCKESGLTVVGTTSHEFTPQGLTFAILLSESHVSIHTWPEDNNVAFDIYTCNYQNNNNDKALNVYRKISELLDPNYVDHEMIKRQSLTNISKDESNTH